MADWRFHLVLRGNTENFTDFIYLFCLLTWRQNTKACSVCFPNVKCDINLSLQDQLWACFWQRSSRKHKMFQNKMSVVFLIIERTKLKLFFIEENSLKKTLEKKVKNKIQQVRMDDEWRPAANHSSACSWTCHNRNKSINKNGCVAPPAHCDSALKASDLFLH